MILELEHLIEPAILIILTVTGWGVRAMLKRQQETDHKIETMATELRSEMQRYIHHDTCEAHRAGIRARFDALENIMVQTHTTLTDRRSHLRDALDGMASRQQTVCDPFVNEVKG